GRREGRTPRPTKKVTVAIGHATGRGRTSNVASQPITASASRILVATATKTTEPSAASRDARRAFWVNRDAAMPMSIGAAARTRIARMRSLAYFAKHEAGGRTRSSAGAGLRQVTLRRRRVWLQRARDAVPHREIEAVVAA